MNLRLVLNQLGVLLVVLAATLLAMWVVFFAAEALWHEPVDPVARFALIATAGLGLIVGGGAWFTTRHAPRQLGRREALLLVALTWAIGAAFAALPFFLWAVRTPGLTPSHPFLSFTDCYFEAMSGLTTTGATVLSDIPGVPRSLLLWRAMTHWLGGLGIVVLFVAVLPSLGVGGKKLFRVEATGPSHQGVRPNIRQTARVLWIIYLAFTVATILALLATGRMDLFDSVCHAFSMVSTGGLSTKDASIAHYDSLAVDLILSAGMLLAGINFALFYAMVQGRFRAAWRDTELRVYLILKLVGIIIVTFAVLPRTTTLTTGVVIPPSFGSALHHGIFTSISMQTGTGFCTVDYDRWPFLAQAVLIGLLFIGGCAGSTAGGVKVIRFWVAIKVMAAELERAFRPNVVRPLKVGRTALDDDFKLGAVVYVLTFLLLFGLGTVLIKLLQPEAQCTFVTAMTASLSSLANVGPGLEGVGATQNFGWFGAPSKWIMCLLMALGRLEVFAVLVLFTPRFWHGD